MDQRKTRRVAPNLYERTTRAGTRIYVVRWMESGRAIERSLGSADALTLKAAKRLAATMIDQGASPATTGPAVPTFAEVSRDALAEIERAKHWKNPRSSAQWRSSIERDALPVLGGILIDKVTRDDVLRVLRPIWEQKPESASRLQQRLAAVFDWAIMRKMRADNPATWRSNLAFALPSKEKIKQPKHHDAPTLEEVRSAVAYCRAHPSPVSGCLLLVIATACRVSEARQATREQLADGVWIVPKDAQKTGHEDRRVPLSRLGLEAVAMGAEAGLLFRGLRGGMIALDAPRLKLAKIIGRATTAHGIRSTFRDWAPRAGIARDIAERCLSHEVSTETEAAYLRGDFLEERRRALDKWAAALTKKNPSRD